MKPLGAGNAGLSEARTVIRPGVGQYVFSSLWPALPIVFGGGTVYLATTPQAQDRSALIALGIVLVAVGLLGFVYLFGMTVEVDDEHVAKVYWFGLFRHSILRHQLRAASHEESGRGGSAITVFDFSSADDQGWGFSVIPFWVWRSRDIDKLVAMAVEAMEWRAAHPQPALGEQPGSFLTNFLWLSLWFGLIGAVLGFIPLIFVWSRFGDAAVLLAFGAIAVVVIVASVVVTWKWGTWRLQRTNGPGLAAVHGPTKASTGPSQAAMEPNPSIGALLQLASALTVRDWQVIYDQVPMGWANVNRDIHSRHRSGTDGSQLVANVLGDPAVAEIAGGGRINFLSHCGDRMNLAIAVLSLGGTATDLERVVAFAPFRSVLPMDTLSLRSECVTLLTDDQQRRSIVSDYLEICDRDRDRPPTLAADLGHSPSSIEMALVAESAAPQWSDARLADALLDLCKYTAQSDPDVCRRERLRWLGFTDTQISPATSLKGSVRLQEREADETGWSFLLSAVATLLLFLGIWIATGFHSWTWVFDVGAGLLSFIPSVAWVAYGPRLPTRRLILWPGRAVALILTVAAPWPVWLALHGLPCPPNCGPGT